MSRWEALWAPRYAILSIFTTCNSYGLYRDDVLAVLDNLSKCDRERISKRIRNIFKKHNFKIDIGKGMFKTDFLNVTLSLGDDTYNPFKNKKKTEKLCTSQSNHPV